MHSIPLMPRFLVLLIPLCLGVLTLLRVGFWVYFESGVDPLSWRDWLTAMHLGLRFDLRLILLLLLPLILIGWFPRCSPFRHGSVKAFWILYLCAAGAMVLLIYAVDFGHYAYLGTRLDVGALRLLENPDVSSRMLWQSYPVLPCLIGLAAVLGVFANALYRLIGFAGEIPAPSLDRRRRAGIGLAVVLLAGAGLYGKISFYPLRWSDAFFSSHAFASQLALNPVLYLADTARAGGGALYDEILVRAHYRDMTAWLGVDEPDPKKLDFRRTHTPSVSSDAPPNVILVILESLASYKSGLSGNPLDATPNLDALARGGFYFPNFYVPHAGTARSIFCLLTGIPDVEVRGTSTRNPRVVEQHTLVNSFVGYEKYYFLGGSASWGNIRGLLRNIDGLRLYEEGYYRESRMDVWGISDLDLFREADRLLRRGRKPFIALIQTAGNHRPYTIPADNEGFQLRHPDGRDLDRWGFRSVQEFNSLRFLDHCVGHFMQLAESSGYLHDTLFVFFGDHGVSGFAGEHSEKSETWFDLGMNRVPFIIHSQDRIPAGGIVTLVTGLADVLPTVAALAGRPHVNTTLGRNVLDDRFAGSHFAFRFVHAFPPRVGLIGDRFYFEMAVDGGAGSLYRLDDDHPGEDVSQGYYEEAFAMERLSRGYHETAKYLLYHNRRRTNEVNGGEGPQPRRSGER
jgi:phosphoglycerol transferase MdoB-like AlkP superfamily enzyme